MGVGVSKSFHSGAGSSGCRRENHTVSGPFTALAKTSSGRITARNVKVTTVELLEGAPGEHLYDLGVDQAISDKMPEALATGGKSDHVAS